MKETEFKNKYFYWAIILIVGGLLMKTIFRTFYYNESIGITPMILQFLLLVFILTKHKFAKIGIIIWTILFLFLFSLIQLIQGIVKNFNYGINSSWFQYYSLISINVIAGIVILFYTVKTTKIVVVNKEQESKSENPNHANNHYR
jgi:hypothetical protein